MKTEDSRHMKHQGSWLAGERDLCVLMHRGRQSQKECLQRMPLQLVFLCSEHARFLLIVIFFGSFFLNIFPCGFVLLVQQELLCIPMMCFFPDILIFILESVVPTDGSNSLII